MCRQIYNNLPVANYQAIDFISVLDSANLELTKTALGEVKWGSTTIFSDTQVSPGFNLTYTLTVHNQGPSTAENVVLQDNLPGELEILQITSSQGRCVRGVPGDPIRPMTCNLGIILPGETVAITVLASVLEDLALGSMIYNEAWTFSDIADPNTNDNIQANYMEAAIKYIMIYIPMARVNEATEP